ncbi:MAG: 4-carboxymuconolactone decarboxylase [Paracoccaceae bacterium]
MSKSETYEKGAATRREVMGDAVADRMATSVYSGPVMETFAEYATEAVFGMLWSRPGLDHKTRAMITVTSDVCNHSWPELEIHLRFALNLGWAEEELTEALLHLGGYIGVPTVREAMIMADRVFKEERDAAE